MKIKDRIRKFIRENKEYRKSINEDYYTDRLDNYLNDPMGGYIDEEIFNKLKNIYPTDKNTKVYRGLNFKNKEAYDKFLKATDNGTKYNRVGIGSWSPNYETAKQFAITRPSYLEFASFDSIELLSKQGQEKITGYKGIILEAIATKDNSFDVRKHPRSREEEIIIKDSSLKIKIVEEFGRFEDELNINDIIGFISKYKDSEFKDKAINYLLANHKEHIDKKAWDYLLDLFISNIKTFKLDITAEAKKIRLRRNKEETYLYVEVDASEGLYNILDNLDEFKKAGLSDKIEKVLKPKLKKGLSIISKEKKKHSDLLIKFDTDVLDTLSKLYDFCGMSKEWIETTDDDNFRQRYKNLTSRQAMKGLSKLDWKDKDKALKKLTQDLSDLLKTLG